MTILPTKRQNNGNNEEPEESPQSNQQIPIGLNIAPARLNHNSLQIGLNLPPGHGQLLKHQDPNERQLWNRHEELQHNRPAHPHTGNFEEGASSSRKGRVFPYSTIPNAKERYFRNLERKRIREQKQERDRARDRDRDLEQKIDCDLKLDLIPKPTAAAGQSTDKLSDESAEQREEGTGYNSEDEYSDHPSKKLTDEEWRQRDAIFARSLEKRGFVIKPMVEDGACLFRAIADQVYGDQEMHSVVRTHCMDYILKNRDFYCAYVTEDFNKYVSRKRHDFVHGNHLEIQALSEMYHRSIEVYCYQLKPINIFHGAQKSDYEPIRLSYQRASHYNSITNPLHPSVGVGLGLPSYTIPSDMDRRQISDAVRQSEDLLIEQTMMEDKLKATDWEATNEVIEEQVARESYLQWCKDNEKRRKQQATSSCVAGSSSTITSAQCGSPRSGGASPRSGGASPRSGGASPRSGGASPRSGGASPRSGGASPRSGGASPRSGGASPRSGGSSPRSPRPRGSSSPQTPLGSPRPIRSPKSPVSMIKTTAIVEEPLGVTDSNAPIVKIESCGSSSSDPDIASGGEGVIAVQTFCETDSIFSRLPPEVFGLRDWEDADVMARVLAASQQEYLDSLKAARNQQRQNSPGPSTSSSR